MSWVRLDDGFHDDERVVAAGLSAAGLLVCGLSYMNRALTDGFLPGAIVRRLVSGEPEPEAVVRAAVAAKLLRPTQQDGIEGFEIHPDFVNLQPTRADVERARAEARARQTKWRHEKRARRTRDAKLTDLSQRDTSVTNVPVTRESRDGHSYPDPDPVPDPERAPKSVGAARPARDDVDALVKLWNEERKPGPHVLAITDQRRRAIQTRLREFPDLNVWRRVIRFVNGQPWCNAPGTGEHASFRMGLDTLLKPGQLARLLEQASIDTARPDGLVGRNARTGRTGANREAFTTALHGGHDEGLPVAVGGDR